MNKLHKQKSDFKKILWIKKKMKTLQDRVVCWPMLAYPETSSEIFRNGRLIRWRKITAVYRCCECSTLIQRQWSIPTSHPTVNIVFTKARQKPVVSRRTFLETVVTGKLFLILNFLKGKTFVKKRKLASGKNGSIPWLCSKDFLFRLVLFLGFNSSTIRTACSSPEKNHCSLHETCLQV